MTLTAEWCAIADAFFRECHAMAPDKGFTPADEPRRTMWLDWLAKGGAERARDRFEDDLRDAHAEYMNESSGMTDDEAREQENDR